MKKRLHRYFQVSGLLAGILVFQNVSASDNAWLAGGGDLLWTNVLNWSSGSEPQLSDEVIFGMTGIAVKGVTTTRLNKNYTVDTLRVGEKTPQTATLGSQWHTFDLGGNTLIVTNYTLLFGPTNTSNVSVCFTNGKLDIRGKVYSQAKLFKGGTWESKIEGKVVVDMRGLTELTVSNADFCVGGGVYGVSGIDTAYGDSTLQLSSGTNVIKATEFAMGRDRSSNQSNCNYQRNQLEVNGVTTINANTLSFGFCVKGTNLVSFGTPGERTLKVRNNAGTGAAAVNIGRVSRSSSTLGPNISNVDFTGGTVDALISTLSIAQNPDSLTAKGLTEGSLIFGMGAGDTTTLFDITTVDMTLGARAYITNNALIDQRGGTFIFNAFNALASTGTSATGEKRRVILRNGVFASKNTSSVIVTNLTELVFGHVDGTNSAVVLGQAGKGAMTLASTLVNLLSDAQVTVLVPVTLTGRIGSDTSVTFKKMGAGELTLSGTSHTFTGTMAIQEGTLRLGINHALPLASALTLTAGSTLDMNGYSSSAQSLSGAGRLMVSTNSTLALTGALTADLEVAFNPSGFDPYKKYDIVTCTGTPSGTYTCEKPWVLVVSDGKLTLCQIRGTMIRFM